MSYEKFINSAIQELRGGITIPRYFGCLIPLISYDDPFSFIPMQNNPPQSSLIDGDDLFSLDNIPIAANRTASSPKLPVQTISEESFSPQTPPRDSKSKDIADSPPPSQYFEEISIAEPSKSPEDVINSFIQGVVIKRRSRSVFSQRFKRRLQRLNPRDQEYADLLEQYEDYLRNGTIPPIDFKPQPRATDQIRLSTASAAVSSKSQESYQKQSQLSVSSSSSPPRSPVAPAHLLESPLSKPKISTPASPMELREPSYAEMFRSISKDVFLEYWPPVNTIIPRLKEESRLLSAFRRSKFSKFEKAINAKQDERDIKRLRFERISSDNSF